MKSKITEKQRENFEKRLVGRVQKMDQDGKLQKFHKEYFYHPNLSFGDIFTNPKKFSPLYALKEAEDNFPMGQDKIGTLLIFSRPYDGIFALCSITLAMKKLLSERIGSVMYFQDGKEEYSIFLLRDFIEAIP